MAGSGQIDMGNKEGGKNNGHDKVDDGYYRQTPIEAMKSEK